MNQFPGDTEEYFARLRVGRESKGLHVSVIENQMNLSRLERMMKYIFQTIAIEDSRGGISERGGETERQTQREAERDRERQRQTEKGTRG
jgi:acyl-CoA hydrolase